MSKITNVTSVVNAQITNSTELSACTNTSEVNNGEVILYPPRVLDYMGMSNIWGYYFAFIRDTYGYARELKIPTASQRVGNANPSLHLACWSPDPHSDDWRPLPFVETVNDTLTFGKRLPNRGSFALARTPGYTVSRVYAQTSKYRENPLVLNTPSAPSGNYGVQVSPSDWRGQPVPDLPLPAYRIGGDNMGKNIIVLTAGNHPYECHADYNLEGSIDFLLSDDPIAGLLREWCDFFIYPTINPAGRWAGYSRSNPELKAAGIDDHNRIWGGTTRDTVVKLKAAFQTDFNQQCDGFIDYHTFYFDETSALRGIWAPVALATNVEYMNRVAIREPDDSNNRFAGDANDPKSLPEWAANAMGPVFAVHSEETALAARNVPEYRASGKALMLALWDMIDDGLMPHGPSVPV